MRNFLLLIIPLMLLNCKSITKVETNRGFKNISTKSLLKNISKEELSYKYLFLRSQATIIKDGRTNQFNLRIRIKNKDKILISGSLLIPLFKGLVTKQEVVFYEKFNKTYYQGSYKHLSKILNFELSLNSLENLLVGRPIEDLESIRLSQEKNINGYTLGYINKINKIKSSYVINPISYNLKNQSLSSIETNNELMIEYGNYKLIDSQSFPQEIIITAKRKEDTLKILLNLKINRIDQKFSFPFSIPKGYKKVEL